MNDLTFEQKVLKDNFIKYHFQEDYFYNLKFEDDMLIVAGFKEIENTESVRYYHGVFADLSTCIYKASNVIDESAKWDSMNMEEIKRKCLNQLSHYIKKLKE